MAGPDFKIEISFCTYNSSGMCYSWPFRRKVRLVCSSVQHLPTCFFMLPVGQLYTQPTITSADVQIWWLLVTLVLISVPYTLWEFKEHSYSLKFIGTFTLQLFCHQAMAICSSGPSTVPVQAGPHLEYLCC